MIKNRIHHAQKNEAIEVAYEILSKRISASDSGDERSDRFGNVETQSNVLS